MFVDAGRKFLQRDPSRGEYLITPLERPTVLTLAKSSISGIPVISVSWFGSVGALAYRLTRSCTTSLDANDTASIILTPGLAPKSFTLNEFTDAKYSDILGDISDSLAKDPNSCPVLRYSLVALGSSMAQESQPDVQIVLLNPDYKGPVVRTTTTTAGSTNTPVSSSTSSPITDLPTPVLFIAIGAAGGLLAILSATLIFLMIHRRNRKKMSKHALVLGSQRNPISQFGSNTQIMSNYGMAPVTSFQNTNNNINNNNNNMMMMMTQSTMYQEQTQSTLVSGRPPMMQQNPGMMQQNSNMMMPMSNFQSYNY